MDFGRIKLILNTVKYLKFEQIAYRVLYALRKRFITKEYSITPNRPFEKTSWVNTIEKATSYVQEKEFRFLNISHKFSDKIDWNYAQYGKLWTYNLNYFDFLNQAEIDQREALFIIHDFIDRNNELLDGLEPYPTSLRLINWIKYVSEKNIEDVKIQNSIYNQYHRLLDNLEYHLLGNHLLENGFSLLFGAFFFQDDRFYNTAKKIIERELEEQILDDGGHFELSPMYHQIILDRLLDCIWLVENNNWKSEVHLIQFMRVKASKMLHWLNNMTFENGDIPMVNDSSFHIAPTTKVIKKYANLLNILPEGNQLNESGYRMIKKGNYEFLLDVGSVGPSYQPGHAHADTFNFLLYIDNCPFIVDPGVSTYNIGKTRERERATSSHNTVNIYNLNSSQVWAGFRVGNRAEVNMIKDEFSSVEASHNGYKRLGYKHTRSFDFSEGLIQITDLISKPTQNQSKAFLHFHPSISKLDIQEDMVAIPDSEKTIKFEGAKSIELGEYEYTLGFNHTQKACKIIITFDNHLQTIFSL